MLVVKVQTCRWGPEKLERTPWPIALELTASCAVLLIGEKKNTE